MLFDKKTYRYYYWLFLEFVRKHIKLILLSFLISFLFIISFISLSPFFETIFFSKKEIIGQIGKYDANSIPEEITSRLSNGLTAVNEKGEFIPALAQSWEILSEGREYKFVLRDNLFWSDGKKFIAQDINYQFKDVKTKVINDSTIVFQLQKPLPIFPSYLRTPLIRYPLIGVAGFYKIDKIKAKYGVIREIQLSANKKSIPFITYKFYDNENQLVVAYKRGEINRFDIGKKSIADVFYRWKNTDVVKSVDYTRLLTLFTNFNNPLFKQKEVREAVAMSIDRKVFEDFGESAVGSIPPISWAYSYTVRNSLYDPKTAEKIIKKDVVASQSGTLSLYTYYDYYNIADEIVKQLKSTGLPVSLNIVSFEKPANFDMLLAYWKVPFDPDQYYFWHSKQEQGNIANYKNVKVDKLLEDGRDRISLDERTKIYAEFQKVIMDDIPSLFLYYPYIYTISRK